MTKTPDHESSRSVEIAVTRTFSKRLRLLKKRYRNVQKDVQAILEEIRAGTFIGDEISGVGFKVMKVRVRNRDISKGKSAGYRLIYYVRTEDSVLLLTIYSKSDQDGVSPSVIRQIIQDSIPNIG